MKTIKEHLGQFVIALAILILAISYLVGNRYKDTGKYIIDTWTSKVYEGDMTISYYKVGQYNK